MSEIFPIESWEKAKGIWAEKQNLLIIQPITAGISTRE